MRARTKSAFCRDVINGNTFASDTFLLVEFIRSEVAA